MGIERRVRRLEEESGAGKGAIHVVYLCDDEAGEMLPEAEQQRRVAEARARMDEDDILFTVVYADEEDKLCQV